MKDNIKTLVKIDFKVVINFLIFFSVVTFLPAVLHLQWITGPIVNAVLFLAVILVGVRNAFLIGVVPSVIALSFGLLPAVLAPLVPFIMMSNIILIVIFDYFKNNYLLGVFVSSLLKFLFLYFSYDTIMNLIFKKELGVKIASMLSWTQFATAILGGIIAFFVLKILKNKNEIKGNF